MKHSLFCICIGILLLAGCSTSDYVVTKDPKRKNPVDRIEWLKSQKKELSRHECKITEYDVCGYKFYAIFRKGPKNSRELDITTIYNDKGEQILKYNGLVPEDVRPKVDDFYKSAEKVGVIWECRPAEK